jgi:hypothetical protein
MPRARGAPTFTQRAARRASFDDPAAQKAIDAGLRWLLGHQDADGRWSTANFSRHDPADRPSGGPGNPIHDVGTTSLCVLALLAQADPRYDAAVTRAADWLFTQLQANGCVPFNAHDYIYSQALLTLALAEATALLGAASHREAAVRALAYLESHRNPGAAWRYMPRDADNDSSVTSWCLAAYAAARDAELTVPTSSVAEALLWLDRTTTPDGYCGYSKLGESSARRAGDHAKRFPVDAGTGLTGAALHARLVHGVAAKDSLVTAAHELLQRKAPSAAPTARDFYSWCHASLAVGVLTANGVRSRWEAALRKTLLGLQCKDGSVAGSWHPDDAFGEDGGRVVATALNVLSLSAPYRQGRHDAAGTIPTDPALQPIAAAWRADQLGTVATALSRLDVSTLGPAAAAAVPRLRWLLELEIALVTSKTAALRSDAAAGPELEAHLARVEARFRGSATGTAAADELAQLRRDPARRREAEAATALAELQTEREALRKKPNAARQRQLRSQLAKFAERYDGTRAARTALELLTGL